MPKSFSAFLFLSFLWPFALAPAQAGLTLCNPTDDSLAVALAQGETVSGWLILDGQGCKQLIEKDLTEDAVQISVVANAIGGESVLSGDHYYCVLWLKRFSTATDDPCRGRARRLLGFYTVPTEGQADLIYTLPRDRFGSQVVSTRLGLRFFGRWTPQLEFQSEDGAKIELASLRGKWVLLLLWADWCAPCVNALAKLDALRKALGAARFAIVAVHSVESDSQERARRIFRDKQIGALELYYENASYRSPKSLARHVGEIESSGVPSLSILDPEGRMIAAHDGELSQELIAFLTKLFGAK